MTQKNSAQSSSANQAGNNDGSDMEWSDEEGTVVDGIYIPPPLKAAQTNEKQSRLIITKITNGFFKSFGDEQILGPFHIRFNAIIGPNGSGKSNVIDSLLFVFGYRASKIRSKKLSVLIHNSENHTNVQSCTVTIYFCEIIDDETDPEKYEIVPGSEFAISRTANKDNSSYYELNGKRVNFKEIARILRHHGIDLIHNRFLILQGEVEEIAMMKCKGATDNETGMLEYIEDVIGTYRYKKPLAELAERVEFLSEKATEKINRLTLVAKELNQLKTPMEEAITFVKAENQIIQCKNVLYQKEILNLEQQSKNLENEREKIAEVEAEFMERVTELNAQKQEKTSRLKEQAKNFEHLQKRRDDMKTNLKNAEKKDAQIQADIVHLNNNRKKCKTQLENERKNFAKLEKVPEENEKLIAEQETDEKQLTKRREKLEEEKAKVLLNIREQTADLQKEKGKLEQELAKLKEKSDASQAEYLMVESKLKICQSSEENEKKKLDEFQQIYEKTKQDIQEKTAESSQLRKKIPLTEKSLKNALERLKNNKQEESQLSSELTEKRYQIEQVKSNMQASRSRGKVLDSLMQQKREGNCDGLYGRLGDLGAIDQKFDVAISTACGRLDNIVVDTVATAQWCIEFLKKYDIGRANFIPLDKQEHLRDRANSKINTPENVHRLYDLVKVQNDQLKTAFYFALGDTLVANDLEQASRIAYGERRFRVVTLKGDLIETSGTMSGGGKSVMRGKMGQSIQDSEATPDKIEKMESQLNKSEEKLRTLRQEQNSLESQARTLEDELRRMKLEYEKLTKDLPFLEEQLPVLNQQYKKQEQIVKTTKTDPAVVKKLTQELDEKKRIAEKNGEIVKKLQDRVDILSNEIKEKSSGKIKTLDKSLNEVIKAIDKCKSESTRLKIAIKTNTKNLTNCKGKIEKLENEIHNAEENLKRMKNERDILEEDATKMIEIINEIEPQLEEAEKIYAEINQEVDKFTKKENKLKSEKVDIDQNIKSVEKKLNTCKETIHQWHVKLNQLKLQKIPKEQEVDLPKFSEEELAGKNIEVIELEMKAAQNSIASSKPNLNAIDDYYECEKIYLRRYNEMNEINEKRNEIKALYERVRNQRKEEFMIGFNQIRTKLQELYQIITLGGNADFEIVDSFDPFTEGIQFNVRPPKKTWKKISNLSGGEKTLSSLALVFAMHYYKPCPLYVMDEIDAALDFKNVSIIGNYIKERTKNAQFIIISLRTNMFELADYLIGIYKTHNSTKTVTIDPRKIENDQDSEQIGED